MNIGKPKEQFIVNLSHSIFEDSGKFASNKLKTNLPDPSEFFPEATDGETMYFSR